MGKVERSGGWAGISFIILVIVAALLPGIPPTPDSTPATVAAFVSAHHFLWQLSAWLIFPAFAFYLWWVVQVRSYLCEAGDGTDGLPNYFLAAGVGASVIVVLIALFQVMMAIRPVEEIGLPGLAMLFDGFNAGGAMIFFPTAVMVYAASSSGKRHRSLSSGLSYLGYLTTLGCAISTASMFFRAGFMAVGGIGTLVMGLLPFTVWVIWVSIVLIRAPR